MKSFYSFIIGFMFYGSMVAQPATMTDIDNHTIVVDSLHGKKILVMMLPLQTDTFVINQLLRFQTNHSTKVKVIGLVSWGGSNPSADSIHNIYRDLIDSGIIITQGIAANDSTANQREGVVKWLSDINRNRESDPSTVNSNYFISEGGKLFAHPGKVNSLDSRLIENIVKTKVPGEN